MTTINILKDFTRTPGARFITDGQYSGEEFREKFLEGHFKDPNDNSKIIIILDGTEGYATSFLEEAFGGLARKYGTKRCLDRLEFISNEDKLIIDEIKSYIEHPDNE
ncbi:STAS-like domain-containing protein [Candidatus Manganitrophus noduliformans]|uniref:DUF4325 domain-containing protein n=1 Tax=Candidatus Manganitrophus noduliformans TaxID=2606439 RepID=A0A7X6IBX4_9BACT|nr:STAS-like domain-containing protein [Candidatus Manganitrophus noduliformans]NKE71859.1 DUF4325 domain-containing protein [Candidatus Manganitrophus noduliformans]